MTCISSSLQCVPAVHSPLTSTAGKVPHCSTVQLRKAIPAGFFAAHKGRKASS